MIVVADPSSSPSFQILNTALQLEHTDWTVFPVVLPANDQVASFDRVSMGEVVSTPKLELDSTLSKMLSSARLHFAGEAVWELRAVGDNLESKLTRNAVEEGDDICLLRWRIRELSKAEYAASAMRTRSLFTLSGFTDDHPVEQLPYRIVAAEARG